MVVVTGGGGFIGRHLAEALRRDGYDVFVIDDVSDLRKTAALEAIGVSEVAGWASIAAAIRAGRPPAADVIFHFGAHTDSLCKDDALLEARNVVPTAVLLELARRRHAPFVYAGSVAATGTGRNDRDPVTPYGRSKRRAEDLLRRQRVHTAAPVVGLRLSNVYGPGERHKGSMASMVYRTYRQLADTGVVRLFGAAEGIAKGEQRRDFVHVGDVTRIALAAGFGSRSGIVDVGTGRSRSFNEMVAVIAPHVGEAKIEYLPFPPRLVGRYRVDATLDLAGLDAMGIEPPGTSLEMGVAMSVPEWVAEDVRPVVSKQ